MTVGTVSAAADRSGPWLLAGITLFWGLNFVAIKYSVEEVPIWTFRSICLLTGGFGLLGIAKAVGLSLRVPRAEWRPLVIAAIPCRRRCSRAGRCWSAAFRSSSAGR